MNRQFLTLNIKGKLIDFSVPKIMGILNVTPDSFYPGSRRQGKEAVAQRIKEIFEEGADIIDVGGCSTRPGSQPVNEEEEYSRLAPALDEIRENYPDAIISVDTFRSKIAKKCIENWRIDILNDIGGGLLDPEIWEVAAEYKTAYVLNHIRIKNGEIDWNSRYDDIVGEVLTDLSRSSYQLRGLGINDIIIDPGFGFSKNTEQNFRVLDELNEFCKMGFPVLAGLSRKSMIWKTLGVSPDDTLVGTVALETIALDRGADIIRVHDVKEARQAVTLFSALCGKTNN